MHTSGASAPHLEQNFEKSPAGWHLMQVPLGARAWWLPHCRHVLLSAEHLTQPVGSMKLSLGGGKSSRQVFRPLLGASTPAILGEAITKQRSRAASAVRRRQRRRQAAQRPECGGRASPISHCACLQLSMLARGAPPVSRVPSAERRTALP